MGGLALVCLTACEGTPLRDAYALSQVDPATTDAEALRVAVAVPEAIQPLAGGVHMIGRIIPKEGAPKMYTFNLSKVPRMGQVAPKSSEGAKGLVRYEYRIDPRDIATFDAFRAAAEAGKNTGGQGSLTVNADLCHHGTAPPDPLPMTVYLKTAELDRFVILTQQDNLRDDLTAQDMATLAPPCA